MIFYCCADLIFATKIRSTGEALGVRTQPVGQDADLSKVTRDHGHGLAHEPSAMMVDLELADGALQLIEHARRALPQTQIIAFGSHVDKAILDAAKSHGASRVLPRSAFTEQLPDLLRVHQEA